MNTSSDGIGSSSSRTEGGTVKALSRKRRVGPRLPYAAASSVVAGSFTGDVLSASVSSASISGQKPSRVSNA